jgi:hypothetical protein
MTLEDIGNLEITESTKIQASKIKNEWDSYAVKDKMTLAKCIFNLYKWPLLGCMIAVWSVLFLEVINFHVLEKVMTYIDGDSDDLNTALICVLIIAFLELFGRGFHKM